MATMRQLTARYPCRRCGRWLPWFAMRQSMAGFLCIDCQAALTALRERRGGQE